MDFGLSSEQTLLQDSVGRFLADQYPLDEIRKVASGDATDAAVWQGLAELGIPGILVPEAQGGVGLGYLDAAVVAESLGYYAAPVPYVSSAVIAPTALLRAGGHDGLLGEIAAGETRVGVAFAEGIGARLDAGVSANDGTISGKSLFVLDADADHYLIATSAKAIYLVGANADGVKRQTLNTVDRTRSTAELIFENAPATLVSDDPAVFIKALDAGRVALAADTLGAAQCMLDQAVAYAKQRTQFNRVIASFQAVKHMCAEMAAGLEPCRPMVWFAGHALDEVPEEERMLACHAKAHLSEVGYHVSRTSTEVHGGMGFTDLVGLHYWFKRIGFNRQLLGSPEMCREEAAQIQGLAA